MLTLREIYQFVSDSDKKELKEYYDKCYDTLKEINKRSNLLTVFILILLALSIFPTFIKESDISGFKISLDIIRLLSPLLIPFFILEWCLIARRRRELMKVMKYAGFKLFKTPKTDEELNQFISSIHTRNTIPFSFMMELLNMNAKSKINNNLNVSFIRILLPGMAAYLLYLAYNSFAQSNLSIPVIICNLLGVFCLIQIGLFYYSEGENNKYMRQQDRDFTSNGDVNKFDLRKDFDKNNPF